MRIAVFLLMILLASSILACTAVPNVADEVTITDFEIVGPGFFAGPSPYVLIGLRANERTYPDTIYYVEVIAFDHHSIGKQSIKWPRVTDFMGWAYIELKFYFSRDDSIMQAWANEEKLPVSQRHLTKSDLVRVVITK